jgi:hypothetical protein
MRDLGPCPEEKQGVHAWLHTRICQLIVIWAGDEKAIRAQIKKETKHVRRDLSREISESLRNGTKFLVKQWSIESHYNSNEEKPKYKTKPKIEFDSKVWHKLMAEGQMFEKFPKSEVGPLEALERLYGDGLVCIGEEKWIFKTGKLSGHVWKRREGWLRRYQFIVPNSMCRKYGLTKEGKTSEKSLDNTGERRFLVIEFDQGSLEEQSRLIWGLFRHHKLVMVVFSGNKSLHSWWDVKGMPEERVMAFFDLAVSIGADPLMRDKSQFTRIPGGINRRTGKDQTLEFFDFQLLASANL